MFSEYRVDMERFKNAEKEIVIKCPNCGHENKLFATISGGGNAPEERKQQEDDKPEHKDGDSGG